MLMATELQAVRMRRLLEDTLACVSDAVELRTPQMAGHQRRVGELCLALGYELNLPPEQREGMRVIGLLHDLGRQIIPLEVLEKRGPLLEEETSVVHRHPLAGYELLKDVDFPWPVARAILQHHERLDGSGYPYGIEGEDILLEARILAVADVVDAMCSGRPYRAAMPVEAAIRELHVGSGRLYDPEVVIACLELLERRGNRL